MSSSVDATNRVWLTILGLMLTAAGGLGLALAFGAFGSSRSTQPVLSTSVKQFTHDQPWFWPAVCLVAVLVAILALRWLLAQTRTERTTRIDRSVDPRDGRTIVHSGALASAVEDDARTIGGVTGTSAHVSEHPTVLHLTAQLAEDADVAAVRRQLEARTVARARASMGQDDLPVRIDLQPAKGPRQRLLS